MRSTTPLPPQPLHPSHHTPMKLLTKHVDRQLQKNIRQHIFANDLMPKIQRIRQCFPGKCLPEPTAEVIAAWNDLPNKMTDILPMSMRTELLFLTAPPPTPTGLAFDMDEVASSDLFINGYHDDDWVFVDDTQSPTPDEVTFQVVESSVASEEEEDSTTPRGHPHQISDGQIHEEDSVRSADSPRHSSGSDSPSSSAECSPRPVEFQSMVNQWLLDYRVRGTEPFIESLFAFAINSLECAQLASRIARVVTRKVSRISYVEGKSLEDALRFQALARFQKCWELEDTHAKVPTSRGDTVPPTAYYIHIASFMGSLFDARVFNAKDVHSCLFFLMEGEKRFDRLCAIHALLVRANDKLCKTRYLQDLMHFKDAITSRDVESGECVWVTTPRSKTIIIDILALIERWMVSQASKREESLRLSGNRAIRNSAVGPRLRRYATNNDLV